MTNHVTLRLDTWAASIGLLQALPEKASKGSQRYERVPKGIKGLPKAWEGDKRGICPCGQDPRTAHCALFQHKCTAPAAT